MIPNGLFTQIGMLILSIIIFTMYIKPSFEEVGVVQSDIDTYQLELEKVAKVNDRLTALRTDMESVTAEDKRKLLTYLPDEVDSISVSRDLFLITQQAGVLYKSVKYAGAELGEKDNRRSKDDSDSTAESALKPHVFNLSVDATYDQLKGLLRLLEQNNYPLEVHALDIQKSEGGFLNVSLDLVTYSFEADIISDDSEVTSYE